SERRKSTPAVFAARKEDALAALQPVRQHRQPPGNDVDLERVRRPTVERVEIAVGEAAQREHLPRAADLQAELRLEQRRRLLFVAEQGGLVAIPGRRA